MSPAASVTAALDSPAALQPPPPAAAAGDARRSSPVDPPTARSFRFLPQRWLAGVDACVKAALMLIPGVFLGTQVTANPAFQMQLATASGVLTLGGLACVLQAIGDFCGGVAVDARGIRVRRGATSTWLAWSDLAQWSLNGQAAKLADVAAVQLWTSVSAAPRVVILGGNLSPRDLAGLQELLERYAPDKHKSA